MTEPPASGLPRWFIWIWFAGCAAWFVDGVFWMHLRDLPHAELAFMLSLLFLAAGFFYRWLQK